jgi:hypothetical protein
MPQVSAGTLSLLESLAGLLIALSAVGVLWIEVRRQSRESRDETRTLVQDAKREILDESRERREEVNLATEERRVAEVNVKLDHSLLLTAPATDLVEARQETPFTIFSLSLTNDGDGPVDILASLTASRIMSSKYRFGIGLHNRDVEWEDHQPYFWNQPPDRDARGKPQMALFTGISTTRTMVADDDEYMRLAPHEHGTLRRIDAINNTFQLVNRAPIYMMYRVFLVARGYPLGEILRQLGAKPPLLLQTVKPELLNFQTIAQPVYARWRSVQEALLNLSKMVFKVATEEDDALGKWLANPDGFRFFLLRHKEFIGEITASNGDKTTMDSVSGEFWGQYASRYQLPGRNQLPLDFGANKSDPIYQAAHQHCRDRLASLLKSWESLKQVIRECADYPNRGYPSGLIPDPLPRPPGCPDEGYPVRVHTDRLYNRLWLEMLNDGYLLSKPSPPEPARDGDQGIQHSGKPRQTHRPRGNNKGAMAAQGETPTNFEIPYDPRVLEPFVMRVHYFLTTLTVDSALKGLYLEAAEQATEQ